MLFERLQTHRLFVTESVILQYMKKRLNCVDLCKLDSMLALLKGIMDEIVILTIEDFKQFKFVVFFSTDEYYKSAKFQMLFKQTMWLRKKIFILKLDNVTMDIDLDGNPDITDMTYISIRIMNTKAI